jgi:hypothetical protein
MNLILFLLASNSFLSAGQLPVTSDFSADIHAMVQQADTNDPQAPLPLRQSDTSYNSEGSIATDETNDAMSIVGNQITTHFQQVDTGMCTTATVMAFLAEVSALQTNKKINLTAETLQELKLSGSDGVGFWGRWNADGPGTALLFQDYGLGRSFQDIKNAKPGDFMKIFWNDRMGEVPNSPSSSNNEQGHSVIYEGTEKINGKVYVKFWSNNSSNTAGFPSAVGFKLKYKKITDIQHNIFSRLEHPENLNQLTQSSQPKTNAFLASLLSTNYSYADGIQASGLKFSDDEATEK